MTSVSPLRMFVCKRAIDGSASRAHNRRSLYDVQSIEKRPDNQMKDAYDPRAGRTRHPPRILSARSRDTIEISVERTNNSSVVPSARPDAVPIPFNLFLLFFYVFFERHSKMRILGMGVG